MTELGFDNPIPAKFGWSVLSSKTGDELEVHFRHTLENLGKVPGLVGIILRKSQIKISNPFDLRNLRQSQGNQRFKKFTYAEIVSRDKANLDILWLKDDSLEDSENLPAPALLAAEIVASLESRLGRVPRGGGGVGRQHGRVRSACDSL